jgi:hypothetical protein
MDLMYAAIVLTPGGVIVGLIAGWLAGVVMTDPLALKMIPDSLRQEERTINAALGGRIVAGWARNAFGMLMFRVHQVDYPEIEAEGKTPAEACDRLDQLLVQAIDFASEAWRRQPLELALVNARAFTAGA